MPREHKVRKVSKGQQEQQVVLRVHKGLLDLKVLREQLEQQVLFKEPLVAKELKVHKDSRDQQQPQ